MFAERAGGGRAAGRRDAFVGQLDLAALGFQRAVPAETGRPGYDPGDLLLMSGGRIEVCYSYRTSACGRCALRPRCTHNRPTFRLAADLVPSPRGYRTITA